MASVTRWVSLFFAIYNNENLSNNIFFAKLRPNWQKINTKKLPKIYKTLPKWRILAKVANYGQSSEFWPNLVKLMHGPPNSPRTRCGDILFPIRLCGLREDRSSSVFRCTTEDAEMAANDTDLNSETGIRSDEIGSRNSDMDGEPETSEINLFFKKMGQPSRLSIVYFWYVKKCPSSIRCLDSNPRPCEHEYRPITTRPVLPPWKSMLPWTSMSKTRHTSRHLLVEFSIKRGICTGTTHPPIWYSIPSKPYAYFIARNGQ